MKRVLVCVIAILSCAGLHAQRARDTSFTVYSAFIKAYKKQPFVSIVYPQLPDGIGVDSNLVYCNIDGRALHLDVFYPKRHASAKRPAVLLIHGGGWRSGSRDQQVPMAQQLAVKGYVAITVEYRLSPEAKYPAAVYDLKSAIRWMRTHASEYKIDNNKVAALGCSAGGQLAALLGTTNKMQKFEGSECNTSQASVVNAVVDIDGILAFIHPESGEGDESKGVSAAAYWFGATKDEKPEVWHEASALEHVSVHTPPVLFINSSIARMHAGRDDMIHLLDSLHIYHEVHTFPDAPHPFWLFNPWFEQTVNYVGDFLNKIFDYKN